MEYAGNQEAIPCDMPLNTEVSVEMSSSDSGAE